MDLLIKNIEDLRFEIARLKEKEMIQSAAIKKRFESPSALFSTLWSIFPNAGGADSESKAGVFNLDIVQIISGFVLPFLLNNTLFKRSNSVVKALVDLASTRISQFINEDLISTVWTTIRNLIKGKKNSESDDKNTIGGQELFI